MLIIGHRGARGLAPENTLASLRKALEHRAEMIEFDVRVTSDDVPVLHHDRVKQSYSDLKQHKSDLATLKEVLATIDPKISIYVEVKEGEPIEPIVNVLKASQRTAANTYLASKSQATLLALHKSLPDFPTIVIEPWSGVRAHLRAHQLGTKFVAMNQRWLWWGFIRGFKNNGWQLYAYTLNDPAKARRWARHGLAGVITDYPDLFQH